MHFATISGTVQKEFAGLLPGEIGMLDRESGLLMDAPLVLVEYYG